MSLFSPQDRENPLDNILQYSLRRAGSVEMLDHSGDEDERRGSRKSWPFVASDHFILAAFLPSLPSSQPSSQPLPPSSLFCLNLHAGIFHPSILTSIISSIKPTYFLAQPPWQIIPPSVLAHLRRRPALPLFILTTIPPPLFSWPTAEHPALTSSSLSSLSASSFSSPHVVPRSASNLENTERKRVKTRLKKLILKRPPLQALQEKGLIKGKVSLCKSYGDIYSGL